MKIGQQVDLDLFGGLVLDMAPSDNPFGCSPDCSDCEFPSGSVRTRDGLLSKFTAIAGNPTVNYMNTFTSELKQKILLALDSSGTLWGELSEGVLTQIVAGLAGGKIGKSETLFGSEWIAFGDGLVGNDLPWRYDGTNFDRVSQSGPGGWGLGAAATDDYIVISTIKRVSGVTTVTTALGAQTLAVGAQVTVFVAGTTSIVIQTISRNGGVVTAVLNFLPVGAMAGVQMLVNNVTGSAVSFFGVFTLTSVTGAGPYTLTWNQNGPDEAGVPNAISGGVTPVMDLSGTFIVATATTAQFTYSQDGLADVALYSPAGYPFAVFGPTGGTSPGVYQVACSYTTRNGYITKPTPPIMYTSLGNFQVVVTGVPYLGPINVTGRLLMFTVANGGSFYYSEGTFGTPQMFIGDIITTSWRVNINDSQLLSSTLADPLFSLQVLGECAWMTVYADRTFWGGERNKITNFLNMDFDGGFADNTHPHGWTLDGVSGAGGQRAAGYWGRGWGITGDGATALRGMIEQSAYQDYLGVQILDPLLQTNYSVRFRATQLGIPLAGNLNVDLYSASLGGIVAGPFTVSYTSVTGAWKEFIGAMTYTGRATMGITTDLILRVYGGGTITNAEGFYIDGIEVFPTNQPTLFSQVRVSKAADPESFDATDGFLIPAGGDGTAVTSAFELRSNLYLVKEKSLYSTTDAGVTGTAPIEPAFWEINEISRKVGAPGAQCSAVGEDWAVIVAREGLYYFTGGEPVKISQEIQSLWNTIDWSNGQRAWVVVDTKTKRVLIGAIFTEGLGPNKILDLDYSSCYTDGDIQSLSPYHFSAYTGKLFAAGRSRRWSPWTIGANCAALVERPNEGTLALFLGNGNGLNAATGKIYEVKVGQYTDDGTNIPSYYFSYFFLDDAAALAMHLQGRKLYSYLIFYVEGSGTINLSVATDNVANLVTLPSFKLANPSLRPFELPINVLGERATFKMFPSDAAGNGPYFSMKKFGVSMAVDPWTPTRGIN